MVQAGGQVARGSRFRRRQEVVDDATSRERAGCAPLAEQGRGAALRVVRIDGDAALKRRLRNMGLMPGRAIEVCQQSPAGVVVSAQGMTLALAPDAARHVLVAPRPPAPQGSAAPSRAAAADMDRADDDAAVERPRMPLAAE